MKVCMIFSEGSHDVAFIRKVLKVCCNATERTKIKLNEFPKPLSLIFQQYVSERDMQDLSLDMVQKFFLPDRVFEKNDYFIMLFSTGGKDNKNNVLQVKTFISDLEFNIRQKPDVISDFSDRKYVFINDADEKQFEDVVDDMRKRYFPITDSTTDETYLSDGLFYVWHGENGKGTLEDMLIKLLRLSNSDLQKKTETYVKDSFDNLRSPTNIATQAKQYKSILTCAGQGESSGLSLSSILIRGKLIKDDVLKENKDVQEFADFLNNIIQ